MATGPEQISEREAEVLGLLGGRLSNAEIAGKLHISVRTVEHHVSALLRKLGAPDRRSLGRLAGRAGSPATGVPVARDSFVGRAHERDSVLALLGKPGLVTLLGPGGVGKTRLAAVLAAAVPYGGVFVDLVPVRDGFVDQAVAAALGVTEGAGQPLRDAIIERLRARRILLVLDNCEHVVDAVAGFVDRVLASCPDGTVLVTTRERLNVPGERVVPIGPLPLAADAEALFVDRARAADPTFTADPAEVALLCARLDGIPLAIELAAARSAALGVTGLLAGVDDALRLLDGGRGGAERHRSLRAVVGWSHDLLDDAERALFRRLAGFVGAFDLTAAAAVAGLPVATVADVLGRLADKSLVVRLPAGGRWRLLETVRAFALEQLDASGELALVRGRRLDWAAGAAEDLLRRPPSWSEEFDAVADDLRAASSDAPPGPDPVAHRLSRALARLAYARRFLTEALTHARTAVDRAPDPAAIAADLGLAASATFAVGPASGAFDLLRAARGDRVALARAVVIANRFPSGFPVDVPHEQLVELLRAASGPADPVGAAHLAAARAWNATGEKYRPDPALAAAAVEAARATGDPVLVSGALDAVGAVAAGAGRLRAARRIAAERVALLDVMDRDDPDAAAEILDVLHNAWLSALTVGDLPAALAAAEAIKADDLLGVHPYRPICKLVPPLVLLGRFTEALRLADPMWAAWRRSGAPVAPWLAPAAASVALAHGLLGDDDRVRTWQVRAERATGSGNPVLARQHAAYVAFVAARLAVHRGSSAAADLVDAAFADFPPGRHEGYAVAAGAELAVVAGLPDAAERLAAATPVGIENRWAAACLARARGRLHGDPTALAESVAGWEQIGARFERAATLRLMPRRAAEPHANS